MGKETDFVRKNINNYLRKYTNHKKSFNYDFYENKEVIKFYTKGFMLDKRMFSNYIARIQKGLRKTQDLYKEIDKLIKAAHIFKKYDFR